MSASPLMDVHPTAVLSPETVLGSGVRIGPYAVLEGPVTLGEGCSVGPHAVLQGPLEIGPGTSIGPGAVIGAPPQDLSWDPSVTSGVRIGSENRIREFATIHRGSKEGAWTVVGNGNFLMAGAHLGHDVHMGDGNVLANNCLVGGHVRIGDHNFFGGGSVFHQFIHIGDSCMIQGLAGFSLDIPPFLIGASVNCIGGVNSVGLRRRGFRPEERSEIKELYQLFYRQRLPLAEALSQAGSRSWSDAGNRFLDFLRHPSRKGICLRSQRAPEP